MAGFARHALVLGSPVAKPPSYMSYTSYWSYRVVLWHVADVPGVQGERMGVALPPLPGRGAAPHQSSQPSTPPLS